MTDQLRDQLHFGIASASLGLNPIHTFENKFQALQKAGFKFCEVDFGSYMTWVRDQKQLPTAGQNQRARPSGPKPMNLIHPTKKYGKPSTLLPLTLSAWQGNMA